MKNEGRLPSRRKDRAKAPRSSVPGKFKDRRQDGCNRVNREIELGGRVNAVAWVGDPRPMLKPWLAA